MGHWNLCATVIVAPESPPLVWSPFVCSTSSMDEAGTSTILESLQISLPGLKRMTAVG